MWIDEENYRNPDGRTVTVGKVMNSVDEVAGVFIIRDNRIASWSFPESTDQAGARAEGIVDGIEAVGYDRVPPRVKPDDAG